MSDRSDYHFTTRWLFEGAAEDVMAVLSDPEDLARWWPAVYLEVDELAPGDDHGVGKHVSLYTKGWLPYTLRWQFVVTEAHDRGWTLEASGDFVGSGVWTFEQQGDLVQAVYDWRIRADTPLLRLLSPLLKPLFAANHRWAMASGEQSLRLELARRRAATPEERERVPEPPRPTGSAPLALLAAGAAGVAALVALGFGALKALRGQPPRRRRRLISQ